MWLVNAIAKYQVATQSKIMRKMVNNAYYLKGTCVSQ